MMHTHSVGVTRARGALVLTVGFVVLLSSAIWLYATVEAASTNQKHVRAAQEARYQTAFAQLDQETSVRGFVSTRDIEFLIPYGQSQATIDELFANLTAQLTKLGALRLLPIVNDEMRINRGWHDRVAAPLIAAPGRPNAKALQILGKTLVDRFRADDRALALGITDAANRADSAVDTALRRIIAVTGLLGICFTLAFSYFSAQRAKILAETTRQRMLYENEKRIANELQGAFVQKALPTIPNIGFHASYVPAGEEAQVGGDWYDAFELPDGRILFSIGDVAGHGIEAAVIMSRARQAIISNALHEVDPALVLRRANETLMLQEPKMVTAICGYIEPGSLAIRYATAGHPPPVMAIAGREPYFIDHDGVPLGILPDVEYGSFIAHAHPGALLVLYTDGVIEHKRDLIEGERRLLEAARMVVEMGSLDPASSVRAVIFADKAPDDDVAIMTVSFAAGDHPETTVNAYANNRLTAALAPLPASARRGDR
jgi:CHASE3 domain sensor protein